jgi:primosomal protein N' (replication factor Y)
VPQVYHFRVSQENKRPVMICHYCGSEKPPSRFCKKCKSWNLTTLGSGIERVAQDLNKIFGKEKILRLDSEKTKTGKNQRKILEGFLKKDAPILITTSIIFKYFPIKKVQTIGMVSIDSLLSLPDFKTEEEGAKIVEKLISICEKNFILQSFFPESRAISWIKTSKDEFLKNVLKERKKFFYPPFSSLIKLSLSYGNRKKLIKEIYQLKRKLEETILKNSIKNCEIMGPSPAFIEKVKGRYNWKLLIKIKAENPRLKNILLSQVPPNWRIDVDPEKII